jgi:hypothetical protein
MNAGICMWAIEFIYSYYFLVWKNAFFFMIITQYNADAHNTHTHSPPMNTYT